MKRESTSSPTKGHKTRAGVDGQSMNHAVVATNARVAISVARQRSISHSPQSIFHTSSDLLRAPQLLQTCHAFTMSLQVVTRRNNVSALVRAPEFKALSFCPGRNTLTCSHRGGTERCTQCPPWAPAAGRSPWPPSLELLLGTTAADAFSSYTGKRKATRHLLTTALCLVGSLHVRVSACDVRTVRACNRHQGQN